VYGDASFRTNEGRSTITTNEEAYEEDVYEDDQQTQTFKSVSENNAPPASSSAGVSVSFSNSFPETISLFWQGNNDDVVKIGDIEAFSQIDVTTFYGHTFFATYQGRTEKLQASKVIMRSKSSYAFEPTEKKVTKNPHVKFLKSRTTAMSAKFRCFVPSTVHIWYDNGLGGSFQGSLTLGKEYTINTYEGHVFFFTEGDDKTKEYARFVMDKDQVRVTMGTVAISCLYLMLKNVKVKDKKTKPNLKKAVPLKKPPQ
jgi:hypothetical protein